MLVLLPPTKIQAIKPKIPEISPKNAPSRHNRNVEMIEAEEHTTTTTIFGN